VVVVVVVAVGSR